MFLKACSNIEGGSEFVAQGERSMRTVVSKHRSEKARERASRVGDGASLTRHECPA